MLLLLAGRDALRERERERSNYRGFTACLALVMRLT